MDYNDSDLGNILNAASQLGNACSGGKSSITISARIGERNWNKETKGYNRNAHWFWRTCLWIVDNTFFPVDGAKHCLKAYGSDEHEDFAFLKGNWTRLVIFTTLMLLVCGLLAPIFWTYQLFKKK